MLRHLEQVRFEGRKVIGEWGEKILLGQLCFVGQSPKIVDRFERADECNVLH